METINIEAYLIRSKDGKYLRAKGYGGYGDCWVDDVSRAKLYTKLGVARSQVTWWSKKYPEYGVPDICKLNISGFDILDETKRVQKSILQTKKKELARKIQNINYYIDHENRQRLKSENLKEKLEQLQQELRDLG